MSDRAWAPDPHADGFNLFFRPVTLDDVPVLERWDRDPDVIAATTDDGDAAKAFGDHDWREELPKQSAVSFYVMAELDGRPVGAMQVIDPYLEPTHYWGDIEPNLRALDIWIGEPEARGKGFGSHMMRAALRTCFAQPEVVAVVIDPLASNTRAHKFYQRLGFKPVGLQRLGDDDDDCLVHRISRAEWRNQFPGD